MEQFQESLVGPGVHHQSDSVVLETQHWGALVIRIQKEDEEAMAELYAKLRRFYPYYFWRQLGPEHTEDAIHHVFFSTVDEVQKGHLREPERLMAFVRVIAYRYICQQINRAVKSRAGEVPLEYAPPIPSGRRTVEEELIREERRQLALECMDRLSPRHREVLERFYLQEQSAEQIQREMGLDETQFRLLKSRAKGSFAKIGQKKFTRLNSPLATLARRSATF